MVVALDEGHHIALRICHGQIYRTASVGIAGIRFTRLISDLFATSAAVGIAEKISHGHTHVQRIGVVMQAVAVGQLHGFQLTMPGLLAVSVIEVKALKDFQGHQGHQSLPAWGDFPHIVAAVVDAGRILPLGAIVLQIAGSQVAAGGAGMGNNRRSVSGYEPVPESMEWLWPCPDPT